MTRSVGSSSLPAAFVDGAVKLQIPPRHAGTGRLRSELVTFLIWPVVCGWKARKSICQQASPGSFDCAPKAVRYAIDPRGASLRMTALWGVKSIRLATQKTRKDRKSHRLSG